uniref:Tubulin--tyrosine ligase-like protein 5 n=1 Tax=Globisporangium ultimum (strain ATCC 200006 / CBS 805.95 / DAOM BR144) TaxID=431595 RepID=K3X5F4_GLOUD
METRLQLCRRLLRGTDDATTSPPDVNHQLRECSLLEKCGSDGYQQHSKLRDLSDEEPADDEETEDGDDENDDEDGDEDEDDDQNVSTVAMDNDTLAPRKQNEKCETASVIKLLFSRHDLTRYPTVCFEYPPHLNTTREYPHLNDDVAMHVGIVELQAADCPLYYKTHWERNCVKNAFAVAGLVRTGKRWTGWHLAWAKHIPKTKFKLFKDSHHAQVFNHFPDPWVIGRKDRLLRTLASCKRRFGASYSFFPDGFTLPDQMDAFRRLLQREDALLLSIATATTSLRPKSSIWILKPPASACGRGIRVITSKDVDSISKDRKYVVQRYIAQPLLLDGYKFDLRIYTLVTSVDPLRIYLFQEGIARFCTNAYSLEKLKNRFSHLTNYSVNKTNDKFVENVDANQGNAGSKWSLTGLLAHLQALRILNDREALMAQIRDIICKTIIAAEAHLTPLVHQFVKKPVTCYELFGFDIMLDSNLTPWLIEVNVSPSLMGGSPLDKRVKGLLLSDIFHLVGVPVDITNLPAGSIPNDLASRLGQKPSDHSTASFASSSSTKPAPFSRSQSSRAPGSASRNGSSWRRSTSTSSTTPSRSMINKQLHEIVLDPNVPHFENNHLELFSPNDWGIIHQMEDEMDRLGHFERIYPSVDPDETAKHAPFFTCQRYANALCAKWIRSRKHKASRLRAKVKRQPTKA